MKKVLMLLGLVGTIGFAACEKVEVETPKCYECTKTDILTYEVGICNNSVVSLNVYTGGVTEIQNANNDATNEGYRATAEQLGYTCTQK